MHRLFVALRPPAPLRERLLGIMGGVPGARWQSDEQLHVTLCFIGEVDRHRAVDIAVALGSIAAPRVELALAGVGAFDRKGRIEALWAGVAPHDPLTALRRKVDHTLARAGCAPGGRAYLPHITLARFARAERTVADAFLAGHAALASPPVPASGFGLYESLLGTAGATYHLVERYALG